MTENQSLDVSKFPVLTLLLVLGCLLMFLLPTVSDFFLYDREKIFAGQWWRLLTGAGVHFSWSHLIYNVVILLIAGWLLEQESRARFVWLVLITPVLSGLYFLLFLPEMKSYAGLSSIVSAVAVFVCLINIIKTPEKKWLWILILILFAAKVIYEGIIQQAFFVSYDSTIIQVVPSAHIIGAMVAIVMAASSFITKSNK